MFYKNQNKLTEQNRNLLQKGLLNKSFKNNKIDLNEQLAPKGKMYQWLLDKVPRGIWHPLIEPGWGIFKMWESTVERELLSMTPEEFAALSDAARAAYNARRAEAIKWRETAALLKQERRGMWTKFFTTKDGRVIAYNETEGIWYGLSKEGYRRPDGTIYYRPEPRFPMPEGWKPGDQPPNFTDTHPVGLGPAPLYSGGTINVGDINDDRLDTFGPARATPPTEDRGIDPWNSDTPFQQA